MKWFAVKFYNRLNMVQIMCHSTGISWFWSILHKFPFLWSMSYDRKPRCLGALRHISWYRNNSWMSLWNDNFTIKLHCWSQLKKCWLEWDLNSHLQDTGLLLYLLSYWVHGDWRRVFIQFRCTRYSCDNLTLSMRMQVQILLESTFFSWLQQCRLIVKLSFHNTLRMILK